MSVDTHVDKAADDLVITTTAEGSQEVASGMKASSLFAPQLATITKDNEGDTQPNTIRFTVQVQDSKGNNLAQRCCLFVYISDAAFGDPATITTLTAATGTDIPITLASSIMVITDATGKVLIDAEVAGAVTRHLVVGIGSSVKSLSATWV